jgi:virginiamycin B lyase
MRAGFRALGLAALLLLGLAMPQASALTPTVTEVDVGPGAGGGLGPNGITVGHDNALWFSENLGHDLGRLVPGNAPSFPSTAALDPTENPLGITVGPDDNLWYAEDDGGFHSAIGTYSPTAGTHMTFGASELANKRPNHIINGPDFHLWFDETNAVPPTVGRITTAGVTTEFPLGIPDPRVGTWGIADGPDGAVWASDMSGNALWRISAGGTVTGPFPVGGGPRGLVAGPDGNLWVAEFDASKIGVVSPSGTLLHEYPVAHKPMEIAVGPDGALWFTANDDPSGGGGAAEVGRITTDGSLFEKPLANNSLPRSITAGPDGNMWFPFEQNNTVAQITVPPSAATGAASNLTVGSATLSGTANDRSQAGTYHFDYGATTGYGNSTNAASLPASANDQAASASLTGLPPSTVYHYRLVVVNGTDTTFGADQTLTTADQPAPTPTGGSGSGSTQVGPVVPPLVPPPPLVPANLDLELRGRAVQINGAGRGTLHVGCAGGEPCAVTGRLTASVRSRRGHRAVLEQVGRLGGSAPADGVGVVRVALNKTGRRLLRHHRRIRANAVGTARSASRSAPFKRVLVLKLSKPRHHHR